MVGFIFMIYMKTFVINGPCEHIYYAYIYIYGGKMFCINNGI